MVNEKLANDEDIIEDLGWDIRKLEAEINRSGIRDDISRYRGYIRTKKVLDGILIAVEPSPDGKEVYIILEYEKISRIVIPGSEYFLPNTFKSDFTDESEQRKRQRKYQMARARVGSVCSFVLKGITTDEDKTTLIGAGSRTEALKIKRDYFFYGERPKLSKGNKVLAKVISSNKIRAKVEAFGVESLMNADDLADHKWIFDVREEFPSGSYVTAYVQSLSISEKGVKMQLSRSSMRNAVFARNLEKVKKGDVLLGQVVAYNREKELATVVLKGDVIACVTKANMKSGGYIFPGDTVSVTVTQINKGKGYCMGTSKRLR